MAARDQVAFITGANKGIGLETARGLGQRGIAVLLGSRDEAKGRAAADGLRAEGIELTPDTRLHKYFVNTVRQTCGAAGEPVPSSEG